MRAPAALGRGAVVPLLLEALRGEGGYQFGHTATVRVGSVLYKHVGENVLAEIARHHRELGQLYQQLADQQGLDQGGPDRVVGLREAAQRLSASKSWLSRAENWRRVGGYKDLDGRVKFADTALRRYLEGVASGGDR